METFDGNLPFGWDGDPDLITRIDGQGRVHSGNFSVGLRNGADLSQEVVAVDHCLFYELSFFARSEGANVGFFAGVTFITDTDEFFAGEIVVREQDVPSSNRQFGYYKLITTQAPANLEAVRVSFEVAASGNQMLYIDDVSLTAR
jgi:hypothetical protein